MAIGALGIMALLPLLEVVVRRFYPSGISGEALFVQHLALWLGFLGAAIAARRGELLSLTLPGERSTAAKSSPRESGSPSAWCSFTEASTWSRSSARGDESSRSASLSGSRRPSCLSGSPSSRGASPGGPLLTGAAVWPP